MPCQHIKRQLACFPPTGPVCMSGNLFLTGPVKNMTLPRLHVEGDLSGPSIFHADQIAGPS